MWKPPKDGQIKANFDATVRQGVDIEWGIIFWDLEGQVLAAATKFLSFEYVF